MYSTRLRAPCERAPARSFFQLNVGSPGPGRYGGLSKGAAGSFTRRHRGVLSIADWPRAGTMIVMFKWATLLLAVVVLLACLGAIGVGVTAMAELWLALGAMGGIALVISWLFLRRTAPTEIEQAYRSDESSEP